MAWYDGATRTVELTSQTAVWYRSGKSPVPIRWVLIRDPQGSFAPQALLCTDPAQDPTRILQWFVLPWQLEVTFQRFEHTWRRDPASVVRPGHRTHHPGPDGSVLLDHPGRTRPAEPPPHDPPHRGLVRQAVADLRRRHRPGEASTCGLRRRVFHCRPQTPIFRNSPSLCSTDLSTPSLTPLELRKVQLSVAGEFAHTSASVIAFVQGRCYPGVTVRTGAFAIQRMRLFHRT